MDFLRKALVIPQFFRDTEEGNAWDTEPNLFKKDMMRLNEQFACPSEPLSARVQALKEIGNIAYIGGTETVKIQSDILPVMMDHLKNPSCPDLVRTQILRTLSMMVHRNRVIQDKICAEPGNLDAIFEIINDATRVLNCRWCCYLLVMIISDNADAMQKVKDVPNSNPILTLAANIDLPWLMWGGNHAETLLKILGFRDVTTQVAISHGAEFARHKDKRGRNVSIGIPLDTSLSSLDSGSSTEIMEAITTNRRTRESVVSSLNKEA